VGPSIRLSAFRWVPPFAQGLARDFRVRWALEEAGLPYEENLIGPEDQATDSYRALQPFGQIPAIERMGSRCSNPAPSSCTSPSSRKR
jgi:glutathione S-transferase